MSASARPPVAGPVRPYVVLLVVGVGTLLSAMAGSMANLALLSIGRDLDVSIEDSRWVIQAFLLTVGVLLLVVGKLSDLWGHRRVYLTGFFLFGITSLACGLAGSFHVLVLFRILQGVGGAMMMATGPALLTTTFPGSMRGRALGMLATATYTGLTLGPPLGGLLISEPLSWRWAFYVNVPVAVVVFALGVAFLPRVPRSPAARFDWAGAVSLLLGLPLVLLALSEGQRWGGSSWMTWGAAGIGLPLLVVFVLVERRHPQPLLDFSLFASRMFTGAALSSVANYVALFAVIMMMPFYIEEGLGRVTSEAGLLLAVQPLVMALVASPSGWLSDRIGSRGLATAGMLLVAAGVGGLSTVGSQTSPVLVGAWLGLVGLGTGVFISPNSSALMGAAPHRQQGVAGGVLAEARVLGMLLGVAMATALFHAAGGRTGQAWRDVDFSAMRTALQAAAGIALAGALAASLRGARPRTPERELTASGS